MFAINSKEDAWRQFPPTKPDALNFIILGNYDHESGKGLTSLWLPLITHGSHGVTASTRVAVFLVVLGNKIAVLFYFGLRAHQFR